MEKIVENRQIVIQNKVLTLTNVRAVAKTVAAQIESISEEDRDRIDLAFVARCDDGSSFQSESLDIFAEDSVIAQKRVTHVSMRFSYYPTKSRVEVILRHGDTDATITVSGKDRIWVAGTLDNLSGLFSSFSPQQNPYLKHPRLFRFVLAMGIGSVIHYLISLYPFDAPTEDDAQKLMWLRNALTSFPMLEYVMKYTLTWFVGWPWASMMSAPFKQLWPSIELQIGPEHLLVEKLRRKLLATVLVLGVVPLAIAVAYDIFKAYAGN